VRVLRRLPQPAPTGADLDEQRAVTAMSTLLDDYWICQEGEPPQPTVARSMPIVVDATATTEPGQLAYPDRPRGLAFWFGDRHAFWDPAAGSIATIGTKGGASFPCVAFGPGGRRAFAVDTSGTGSLWDVTTGVRVDTVAGIAPEGFPERVEPDAVCTGLLLRDLTWSADGSHLFIATNDGRALFWNMDGSARRCWSFDVAAYSFAAFSSGGTRLMLDVPPRVTVRDASADHTIAEVPARFAILSRNGDALLASSEFPTLDARVQLFRLEETGAQLKASGMGCRGAFSASGNCGVAARSNTSGAGREARGLRRTRHRRRF
jgi:hypothetical protein